MHLDKVRVEAQDPVDIHGKPYSRALMVGLILVATFAAMLMQTVLGTTIPTLMKDFDITMATAQQATTWFLLANGIMVPVSAYLATRFSTKWLYISAYAILFIGLIIIYTSPTSNWWIFIGGRMMQAVAAGITMPLMQMVFVNIFPPKQMGAVMGLGGLVVGLAPAIGPTYAGWILDQDHSLLGITLTNSWRTIFLIPMVLLGICFFLAFFLLRDVIPNRDQKLDLVSLLESIIGFGLFLYGFTNVANDGWGDFLSVILPILAGVVIIVLFIGRQIHAKDPFLNVRVFKNKQFALTTATIGLATMAMMGVEMMLPLYLQEVHGLSALSSGLTLLPGAIMMGAVSPLAGRAYDKVGARRLALVGAAILGIGTIPFVFFGATTPEHFVTILYAVRMFGIAMIIMPLTASAMNSIPKEVAAHGTASNNTARQIASAVVVALLSSVTQNIITTNTPAKSLLSTNPIRYMEKMMNAMLNGYHVSFLIGFCFAVIAFIIGLFLKKGKIEAIRRTSSGDEQESQKLNKEVTAL